MSHLLHHDLLCHYDMLYHPNRSLHEPIADNLGYSGLSEHHKHAPRVCDHYKKEFCDPHELVYRGKYVIHKMTYAVLLAKYDTRSKLIFHDIENKYWFFLCLDDGLTEYEHHSGISQA